MTRRPSKLVAQGPAAEPIPVAAPAEPAAPVEAVEPRGFEVCVPVEPPAGADVLECPAHLLGFMPTPATLVCAVYVGLVEKTHGDGTVDVRPQPPRHFIVTTSQREHTAAVERGVPAFTGKELVRMAAGAAADRARLPQLLEWLDAKTRDGGWVLTRVDALGISPGHGEGAQWTIGRLFARLGVSLLEVRLES